MEAESATQNAGDFVTPRHIAPTLPRDRRQSPVIAAIVASSAILIPIPLLRGALFALFPGIAWRSWRLAAASALAGVALDLGVSFFQSEVLPNAVVPWLRYEPLRNPIFDEFLPIAPGVQSAEHNFPDDRELYFGIGLTLWIFCMLQNWSIWWPRAHSSKSGNRPAAALTAAVAVPIFLLTVDSLRRYFSFYELRASSYRSLFDFLCFFGYFASVVLPCTIYGYVVATSDQVHHKPLSKSDGNTHRNVESVSPAVLAGGK